MDILEAITRELQRHGGGYKQTHPLARSLTGEEVLEFMTHIDPQRTVVAVHDEPIDDDDPPVIKDYTVLKNITIWHPICRLKLMLVLAHSLHSQGHI